MKLSDEMAVQSANWSSVLDTRAKAELVLGDVTDWASRVARLERVATVAGELMSFHTPAKDCLCKECVTIITLYEALKELEE